MPKSVFTIEDLRQRFWSRVDKAGPVPEHRPDLGRCWLWTGYKGSHGYGQINFAARSRMATHVSLFLATGHWPSASALHHCDNPPCVNPDHLFLGTQSDNLRDMKSKGRAGWVTHPEIFRSPSRGDVSRLPFGESHHSSKLTWSQVREIRQVYRTRRTSWSALAQSYGVRKSTIGAIIHHKNWREQNGNPVHV